MLMIIAAFVSHLIETFLLNSLLLSPPKTTQRPHSATMQWQKENSWSFEETVLPQKFGNKLKLAICAQYPESLCGQYCFLQSTKHSVRKTAITTGAIIWGGICWRLVGEWDPEPTIVCWSNNPQSAAALSQEKCSIFFWTGGIYPPPPHTTNTRTHIGQRSSIHRCIPANKMWNMPCRLSISQLEDHVVYMSFIQSTWWPE